MSSADPATPIHKPSSIARFLDSFRNAVYTNLPPGPKVMPMRYVINIFKGLTFLWVLGLMFYCGNFSTGMKLYFLLHGSYGWFWFFKDVTYPDASFKQLASIGSLAAVAGVLLLYWMIPVTIALGYGIQEPSTDRIALCVGMYISGVILMMGSDIQKTSTLAKRKGLISTGFFARTRNPNYLGEILIYGSFAICTGHWISYAICGTIWSTLFAINMYLKDQYSYKNKKGWQEYRQKSYMLLPKIFRTDVLNFTVYCLIVAAVYQYYYSCCDGHGDGHHHHHGFGFHSHNHTHGHAHVH